MKNRIVISMMVLAMAGATLTGCGGSTETEVSTEVVTEETSEEVTEEVTEEEVTEEVVEEEAEEFVIQVTDGKGRNYVSFTEYVDDSEVQDLVDAYEISDDESYEDPLYVYEFIDIGVYVVEASSFDELVDDYYERINKVYYDFVGMVDISADDAATLIEDSGIELEDDEFYLIDNNYNVLAVTEEEYQELHEAYVAYMMEQ